MPRPDCSKMRVLPLVALLSAAFASQIACGQIISPLGANPFDEATGVPLVELRVSPQHRELFVPFARRARIPGIELPQILMEMRRAGNEYCAMLYKQRRYNRSEAEQFIFPDALADFRASHRTSYLSKLIAGCWNFYIMNDVRPFLDFELARVLFPDARYECSSVGLMQPYIMHNILGCDNLQMLDIDWRIHATHWRMLELYGQRRFGNRTQALAAIKELEPGWIAFAGPLRRKNDVDLATLCRHNRDLCLDHLVRFQASVRKLDGIRMDLAALHDGVYAAGSPAGSQGAKTDANGKEFLKVIYLSNAIEGVYTTRAQFDLLLARVAGQLPKNGRAIYIYHAAGTRALGFYEQTQSDAAAKGYDVRTVCKDQYRRRDANNELEAYTTHFERVTATRGPGSCQARLRKARLL